MHRKSSGVSNLTSFCCNAFARCRAPWAPIWLLSISSVVSVCGEWWTNRCIDSRMVWAILLCFAATHLQDVRRLDHRFRYLWGQALWVPVKIDEWIDAYEVEWCEQSHHVLLQCIRKMFGALSTDFVICEVKCCERLWKRWMNRCIGSRVVWAILPCVAATHSQDVLRLEHRFGCLRGQVLWASVEKDERIDA